MKLDFNDMQNVGEYTTGEVAKYLDVSIQTINEWIKSKKIRGAYRTLGDKGHWRIPATATMHLRNGKVFVLSDVLEESERLYQQSKNATPKQHLEAIEIELAYFEQQYSDIKIIVHKQDKSVEEIEDMKKWLYWLSRYIEEIRHDLSAHHTKKSRFNK